MKEMLLALLLLIIGFVLLIKGADFFVDGSSSVAKRLKVPSMIIGLTIVAMGTSLPECAVSVTASLNNNNALAVSNVIGSNIFNLMVVCGVCALFTPLAVSKDTLKNNTNENIQGEESVQSQQVDINIVYEEVHRMANTIIIPEDGNKWGEDEITKERIEKVLYELNGRDDYLNKELNKWNNSDFSNGVKVHNYVWSKLGGTIGKAKSLNDVNVQKAINLLNN